MDNKFKAWHLSQQDKVTIAKLKKININDLMLGDTVVKVVSSGINYKDALALTGKAPVVRKFPMIPGIDLAGIVEDSDNPLFKKGDNIFATGHGMGEIHYGGLSEYARIDSQWLLKVPKQFSCNDIMSIGTAGLTAMLCVIGIEESGITPNMGEIVVTGATGGVGAFAIMILSKLGFRVVASTGKIYEEKYLMRLGAERIIDNEVFEGTPRLIDKETWASAIDVIGGNTLSHIISQTARGGAISVCGQIQGINLSTNMAPFILRGIKLLGVDSAYCKKENRENAWNRLTELIDLDLIKSVITEIDIDEVLLISNKIIEGNHKGRYIVNM
jgi:acrylyl-CoA reductase (NADPH)